MYFKIKKVAKMPKAGMNIKRFDEYSFKERKEEYDSNTQTIKLPQINQRAKIQSTLNL